jgi:serine/threonine-protein kinase
MSQSQITSVGKYRVLSQIGEGAMGVVYRALDPVLNRPVAIKVMSDAVARDESLRERFLREAQAAGSLQHPNVITIYDFGEVDGHLYIAMEFVEGDDLEDLLAKRVPLSLAQKIDILVEVLTGLSYAHKRGIVHRDIKPANIRIDEEGRARIMDFGIAHITSSNMTRTGVMVGTPAYMAPEQIVGGPVSAATDIFSVGAVMYELLTNAKPFDGETLQTIMYKIVSQSPPDVSTLLPGLPASLNVIVQKALAKEPSARYATSMEMANALSSARAALPDSAAGVAPLSLRSTIEHALAGEHAMRRAKRRRAIAVGAGGVGVAALAVLLGLKMRDDRTPSLPTNARTSTTASAANAVRDSAGGSSNQSAANPAVPASTSTGRAPGSRVDGASEPAGPPKTTSDSKRPPAVNSSPTTQELALFRSLQSTALQARRSAVEVGATADQLQAGDEHNKSASTLVQQGRITQAADRLDQAAAAWSMAERAARQAAAALAAAQSRAPTQEPEKKQTIPPAAPPVSSPPSTSSPAPVVTPPAPVQQSSASAANEIAALVAAYARAIESRDLAAVRRAYSGITPTQAKGFEQFFGSVRSLRANLSVGGLEISGATAEARLSGVYEYVTNAGKTEQQRVSFQAGFKREGGSWELRTVR